MHLLTGHSFYEGIQIKTNIGELWQKTCSDDRGDGSQGERQEIRVDNERQVLRYPG